MSELKNIQDERNSNRNNAATVNVDLQKAKAALDKLNTKEKEELKGLNVQEREGVKSLYEEKRRSLVNDISRLGASKKSLKDKFDNIAGRFLAQLDPVEKIA